MTFGFPMVLVGKMSIDDDAQRCLSWSKAHAAPQLASSLTLLLAVLEAGTSTTARRVLSDAGVAARDIGPLELVTRAPQPVPAKGLKRLARLLPNPGHGAAVDRVTKSAAELCFLDGRKTVTTDDLFVALLTEGSARDTLISLGTDPDALRDEVIRSRPIQD